MVNWSFESVIILSFLLTKSRLEDIHSTVDVIIIRGVLLKLQKLRFERTKNKTILVFLITQDAVGTTFQLNAFCNPIQVQV